MAKQITISNDSSDTVYIEEDNTEVLVEKGYNLAVADGFGIYNAKSDNAHITVNGHVDVVSMLKYGAITTYGTGDSIKIGEDGSVKGPRAIQLHGEDQKLVNHGIVDGADYGVQGDNGGYHIVNTGEITSVQGYAVALGDGDDTVVNKGVINGSLETGDGADHIHLRGGTVNGGVFGGDGNDVYFMGNDSAASLFDSGGYDIVRTSVSYVADPSQGIEAFVATGRKNIDLTGDGNNNSLGGNSANNHIAGGAGEDVIAGGAGHDVLTGGDDADTFYFRKGDGHDQIADFTFSGVDHDVIDLQKFDVASFHALKTQHMENVGDDLVISFGDDTLTLKHTHIADIGKDDFAL